MRVMRIVFLTATTLATQVVSNAGFKWSALSTDWRGFLWGQVVGNLTGFLNVLALTFLIRDISLHRAFAVNFGLGFILVQVLAAGLFFREPMGLGQWLGCGLVFTGVLMICLCR